MIGLVEFAVFRQNHLVAVADKLLRFFQAFVQLDNHYNHKQQQKHKYNQTDCKVFKIALAGVQRVVALGFNDGVEGVDFCLAVLGVEGLGILQRKLYVPAGQFNITALSHVPCQRSLGRSLSLGRLDIELG